jgi:mono/diheme cytochrome c family protein
MKSLVAAFVFSVAASGVSADALEEHDFILNCSGCHQVSGSGSATVPSLHNMAELMSKASARAYFIRVPGVAHAPLSSERLAALMNWVLQRFTGKAPTPRYTAKEVSDLRKSPFLDPFAARAVIVGSD